MAPSTQPTWFISHGGGPWPWMEEYRREFRQLEASLVAMRAQLGSPPPRALLMVTAHWEAPEFRVSSGEKPGMIYDYSGFPAHTYAVRYDAPGSPEVAARVRELLGGAGIAAALDPDRGFDHGTFTPLVIAYPDASVPVVQLSIRSDYEPAAHLAAGRALAPLRQEEIAIVGSGFSYHNLRRWGAAAAEPSRAFDDWLQQTLVSSTPAERAARLLRWEDAPSARIAHPRPDHLLPLLVAVGAAGDDVAACFYHEENLFGGAVSSSWRFGAPPSRG